MFRQERCNASTVKQLEERARREPGTSSRGHFGTVKSRLGHQETRSEPSWALKTHSEARDAGFLRRASIATKLRD